VPEDCDQRNERWGWMADASVSAEGNYQFHWIGSLYTSWLTSMRDVQTEPGAGCAVAAGSAGDTNLVSVNGKLVPNCSGAVGDLTPGTTPAQLPGDPSWMFAYPLVFSYQHRYMADARLAAALYSGIKGYADFLKRMADAGKTGLVTWKKYGDWLQPGRVPSLDIIGEISSSFNYGQTLRIARDTAAALSHADDAAAYAAAYTKVQTAVHAAYFNASAGTYGNGQQAALVYALYLGAVPAPRVDSILAQLLQLIRTVDQPPDHSSPTTQQCGKPPCIDTGILATKWLMETLSLHGRTDVGLDLAFQTD
jgi:alpha-L-rhamnosidase